MRINATTNVWEISIDGGTNWTSTGVKATGDKGATGAQGDAIFAADGIDYTSDPDNVTFTLADGATTITLPRKNSVIVAFESYEIVDAIVGIGCPDINVVMPDADTYTSVMAKIECSGGTSIDVKTRAAGSTWSAEIIKGAENKVSIKVTPAVDAKEGDVAILTVSVVTKTGALTSASRTIQLTSNPIEPSGDTYAITSVSQLGWVLDQINNTADFLIGKTLELESDLDLTGYHLKPIGAKDDGKYAVFTGTFDGKNHTVRGVNIKRNLNRHVGFFSVVEATGVVQNLNIEGSIVNDNGDGTSSGGLYTGGIVGFNKGRIINCSFKGSVNSYNIWHTGGIVGVNAEGLVAGCRYLASEGGFVRSNGPDIPDYSNGYTGGIVGYNYSGTANAYIIGCYNTGRVKGSSRAGGIVGESFGTAPNLTVIVGCYNQGVVTSEDKGSEVGGIAGAIGSSIIQACYNTGSISRSDGTDADVGAIMGRDVTLDAADLLNTNYWLTGSAPQGYSNIPENQVVDCVSQSEAELNSQETINALNAAIDAWNVVNNNLCDYKYVAGAPYPVLVKK